MPAMTRPANSNSRPLTALCAAQSTVVYMMELAYLQQSQRGWTLMPPQPKGGEKKAFIRLLMNATAPATLT